MRNAIRESLEILCIALNRLEELEHDERDAMQKLKLQSISTLLARARGYLIDEDRKEVR